MKLVLDEHGNARGYVVSESGTLTITPVCVIDGQPVPMMSDEPYDMSGPVVDLMGWPDTKAVDVGHNLLIAVAD